MDDFAEIEEKLVEKQYKEQTNIKHRDPAGKTSRQARSESRQNAKNNTLVSDEEVIKHELVHLSKLIKNTANDFDKDRLIKGLVGWLSASMEGKNVEEDISYHFTRAQGAGGQYTNKKQTVVICVHKQTLIRARCEDSPDQELNRKEAMETLKRKLTDHLNRWLELRRLNPEIKYEDDLRGLVKKLLG